MIEFTDKDRQQFGLAGISEEKVLKQITTFEEGIAMINLEKEAVVSSGILKFSKEQENSLIQLLENSWIN